MLVLIRNYVFILAVVLLFACQNQPVVQDDPPADVPQAMLSELENPTRIEKPPQQIAQEQPAPALPPDVTTEGKKLSTVTIRSIESIQEDGMHDMDNDAVIVLQDPKVAMADFPLDRRQQVNWVQALERGFIKPRADLLGEGEMLVMDMDIIMRNTQFMPNVRFPHYQHTKWLDCSNCHPKIFIPQEHANPITMNAVLRGEYCGVCHDKVAFALFTCERCHSVPTDESGQWWEGSPILER